MKLIPIFTAALLITACGGIPTSNGSPGWSGGGSNTNGPTIPDPSPLETITGQVVHALQMPDNIRLRVIATTFADPQKTMTWAEVNSSSVDALGKFSIALPSESQMHLYSFDDIAPLSTNGGYTTDGKPTCSHNQILSDSSVKFNGVGSANIYRSGVLAGGAVMAEQIPGSKDSFILYGYQYVSKDVIINGQTICTSAINLLGKVLKFISKGTYNQVHLQKGWNLIRSTYTFSVDNNNPTLTFDTVLNVIPDRRMVWEYGVKTTP